MYQDLDFNTLVEMCCLHQTHQAATGVRTKGATWEERPAETERKQLIRRFHEVLKEAQSDDVAAGSGVEQKVRWTGQAAKGGQVMAQETSGNTANAIAAATSHAVKVCYSNGFYPDFNSSSILCTLLGCRTTIENPCRLTSSSIGSTIPCPCIYPP